MNPVPFAISCVLFTASAIGGLAAELTPRQVGNPTPAEIPAASDYEPGLAVELIAAEPPVVAPSGSIGSHGSGLLQTLLPDEDGKTVPEASATLYREAARQLGMASRADSKAASLLIRDTFCRSRRLSEAVQAVLLTGLAEGLATGATGRFVLAERTAVDLPGCDSKSGLQAMAVSAARAAADPALSPSQRQMRVEFLRWCAPSVAAPALTGLVVNETPAEVLTAAVRALVAANTPGLAKELLAEERWSAYLPGVREAVLAGLLSRPDYHPGVLSMVECEVVPKMAIPVGQREQWLKSADPVTRTRAQKLFKGSDPFGEEGSGGNRSGDR